MIQIHNNFLPEDVFHRLQAYSQQRDFQIVKLGDKEFSILPIPEEVLPFLQIPGHELFLSFLRSANHDFDTDLRIHADNTIEGSKTTFASVLYVNSSDGVSENGTCFWKHKDYGVELPSDITNEEFDRLIVEDSNDISKWERLDKVTSVPNKLVAYKSNLFHSKWPKRINKGERIVLVSFYRSVTNIE